jgi:hypothetical protein
MRRLLLIAAVVGGLTMVGAKAVQAGPPAQFVDWDHHHHDHVVVERCYPPVRVVRPEVVYYPQVVTAPAVVSATPVIAAPPAGFISLSGRHFGIQFGF